jgi:hypothetical protein
MANSSFFKCNGNASKDTFQIDLTEQQKARKWYQQSYYFAHRCNDLSKELKTAKSDARYWEDYCYRMQMENIDLKNQLLKLEAREQMVVEKAEPGDDAESVRSFFLKR